MSHTIFRATHVCGMPCMLLRGYCEEVLLILQSQHRDRLGLSRLRLKGWRAQSTGSLHSVVQLVLYICCWRQRQSAILRVGIPRNLSSTEVMETSRGENLEVAGHCRAYCVETDTAQQCVVSMDRASNSAFQRARCLFARLHCKPVEPLWRRWAPSSGRAFPSRSRP